MMEEIEKEYVHKVYSEIAAHFSDTRYKPWPRIAKFLQDQPVGSLIADVGCGNGKYLGVNDNVAMLGSDICPELVSISRSRGHEVLVCDCLNLPYRNDQFDSIICIAVVHHLSTHARRKAAVVEMTRVLRPGGSMLIYVWAMEQERKKFDQQDVMVPWHLQRKYRGDTEGEKKEPKTKSKKHRKGKKRSEKRQNRSTEGVGEEQEEEEELGEHSKGLESNFQCLSLDKADDSKRVQAQQLSVLDEEAKDRIVDRTAYSEADHHNGETRQQLDDGGSIGDYHGELEGRLESDREPEVLKRTDTSSDYAVEAVQCRSLEEEGGMKGKCLVEQGYSTYHRFYHVFREQELPSLVQEVDQLKVKEEYYDHENWCVVAIKTVPQ